MLKVHENLGDYLVINRVLKLVELPRLKVAISSERVSCFQWMRGRSSIEEVAICTKLYLLVWQSNSLIRYHILDQPNRKIIEEVVAFSQIPLEEFRLDKKWDIEADCDTFIV
jgi:hypothetical protein